MPDITGKFVGDFSGFLAAVESAEVKLRSFETGSNKVETALNRMVDSFTGRKLISEAALMVEALDRIGGKSKLTADELQNLAVKATAAADKMRAMGIEVPTGLQNIANELKNINTQQDAASARVDALAKSFVALFTVRAAAQFVENIASTASALQDLSQQTHINVEELQLLASAVSEFGVDADTLGKGLFALSRKIAGGDDSVATGLHLMGLGLKDVEGLQGEQLFLKIERGLATLQGSLRDTAAADIFGGRLGAAMAGASEGIDKALETAKRLNVVMSKETAESFDKSDEAVRKLLHSLEALAANLLGPTSEGFNEYIDDVQRAGFWNTEWARTLDFLSGHFGDVRPHMEALIEQTHQAGKATDEFSESTIKLVASHESTAAAMQKRADAAKFMAALEADAAKDLEGWQIKHLEHQKEIGALNAANAAGVGASAAQFAKYAAGIEAAKAATAALAQEQAKLTAAQREADAAIMSSYQTQIQQLTAITAARKGAYGLREQIDQLMQLDAAESAFARSVYESLQTEKERMKLIEDEGKRHTAMILQRMVLEEQLKQVVNQAVLDNLNAQIKLNESRGRDAAGAYEVQSTAADRLRLALDRLAVTEQTGIDQSAAREAAMKQFTDDLLGEAKAADDAAQSLAKRNAELAKAEEAAKRAADEAKKLKEQIMLPTSAELDKAALFPGSMLGFGTGPAYPSTYGIPQWNPSSMFGFGGGRASGGPVSGGVPYLVGEQGPELFTPASSGGITPNGGGITVNVNVSGMMLSNDATARAALSSVINETLTKTLQQMRKMPGA